MAKMTPAELWLAARRVSPFAISEGRFTEAVGSFGFDEASDLGEVMLALACDAGHAPALRTFDQTYLAAARPLLARQGASADLVDETLQRLREDLLLHKPGEPFIRLVRYAGAGRLASLVRVSAARTLGYLRQYVVPGSSSVRSTVDPSTSDSVLRELWSGSDPELHVIGDAQQQLFKACFATAVAVLSAAERATLRFYFVEELTYQEIADLFGVNKSTICRQLAAANARLLEHITAQWQRTTGTAVDMDLRELIDGELDLSMSRLFRT